MNTKSKLISVALSSLFTAIICILAQISIMTPFGVPLTFQILGVALCGYLLGVKKAVISVLAYIFLGLVGIPVFSGFKGGIHALFGLTGGFVFGFLAVAFFCGISKKVEKTFLKIVLSAVGILICHICGIVQLAIISKLGLLNAFLTASLPFLLKDFLLVWTASILEKTVRKRLNFRYI